MVSSAALTIADYLQELPPERRAVVGAVRDMVNASLPPGYVEAMAFGMIGWVIPLSRYPETYNKQPLGVASLAAQKHGYSLYLNGVYSDAAAAQSLREAYARAGKKLDMGKSCLRFRSLDGLLMDEVARIIASTSVDDFIRQYERSRASGAGSC